jgi:hypothetical protein
MSLADQIQKRIDELRASPENISANELKIASSLVDGNIKALSEQAQARLRATPGFIHLFGK